MGCILIDVGILNVLSKKIGPKIFRALSFDRALIY